MTNRKNNKNTTRNVENSLVIETSAERIARLEVTVDKITKKIQTMQDDLNNRIESLHQLINDNDTKSFIIATKINQDVEQINDKIRNKVPTESPPIKQTQLTYRYPLLKEKTKITTQKKF